MVIFQVCPSMSMMTMTSTGLYELASDLQKSPSTLCLGLLKFKLYDNPESFSYNNITPTAVADLTEGSWGPSPPLLFWVKKEEIAEGRKAGRAS